MSVSARTAPKTKGIDNLIIKVLDDKDKKKLITAMNDISKKNSMPSCARDAKNIADSPYIVIIAAKKQTMGLDCGFCGYKSCKDLASTKGICAYNSIDLGIALGSASATASNKHADNRIMYSIGKASMECGLIDKSAVQAIGIPLSATGKNPFFDRK